MRKLFLIVACTIFSVTIASAEKFMTRTGKVTFFSTTPIENIEAFNNEVAGIIDTKTGSVIFIVPIKSFRFEKALMQQHFNAEYMESDRFPKAEFKGNLDRPDDINFSKSGNYQTTVSGRLTIHGVTKQVRIPGTISVQNDEATVHSKFKVKTADYSIKIPALVAGKIADEIEVEVNCVLKKM